MIKIVVDGFGGDNSPLANIEGTINALNKEKNLHVILTGDEVSFSEILKNYQYDKNRLTIVNAPDIVSCNDKPTNVLKEKPESSLAKAVNMVHSDDTISGMVSVGSTGAVLVGAVLRIGRINGVIRPAFCPILPTMKHTIVGVCDSGANVDCDAARLQQFAIMGSAYMKNVYGVDNPKVALLNVGTEEEKGDLLHKETYKLLKETKSLNFVGNMEGRDLLSGNYDLIVCDGFSGNVLIKSTEGACLEMLKLLKKTFYSSFKNKIGALLLKKDIYKIKDFMDYNNYGGGVMLGTKKIVVKGHGSSKHTAITNCIIQAYTMAKNNLCDTIKEEIDKINIEAK